MPKELRKIIFNDAELKSAVYDYCLRSNINIPHSQLEEIKVNGKDAGFLTMCFASEDSGDPRKIALGRDQVGAALIKFCVAKHIPLPRSGQKILKVEGQVVSMLVHVDFVQQKTPLATA